MATKVTPPLTHGRCCCTIALFILLAVVQIKSFSRNHHFLDHRRAAVAAKQTTQRPTTVFSSPRRSSNSEDDESYSSSSSLIVGASDDALSKQHRRRAFLSSSFASTSSLLLLASTPTAAKGYAYVKSDALVLGSDEIMLPKAHGTTDMPVQENLRFGVSRTLADRICCHNRMFAEMGGYFDTSTSFEKDVRQQYASSGSSKPMIFYDSVSGLPLFRAPIGRTVDDFIAESKVHGWPSFRDDEVVWDNVRILKNGETVSIAGTHLGHDIPDGKGNRYCINLVSVAGNPA